jgi:16S rRNA (guanine527-N7)-methyltransferase
MSPASGSQEEPSGPDRFEELLRESASPFGIARDSAGFRGCSIFLAELDRWRRKTNLTGKLTARELAAHTLESLLGSKLIIHGARVVDIGSGSGFPGLPIAIERPDVSMTLVEPRAKRTAFLRHAARQASLGNVAVLEGRIEEVGGQTFDVATTRAVGGFSSWLGQAAFLAPRGLLLAWTTQPRELEKELAGFTLESILEIPGSERRRIASFRKRS